MTDKLEIVARVVHEAIRAYQTALGESPAAAWDKAREWERTSTITGVRFRMENPNTPPSHQHNQWMSEKLANGWTYGPVKDPSLKTHPSLVPYAQLPETERRKDQLFAVIVRVLVDPMG